MGLQIQGEYVTMYNLKQKNHLSKFRYSALSALFCAALSLPLVGNAQAECSREDIDHYLAKGFTPAQITSICTKTEPPPAVNLEKAAPRTKGPATLQPAPQENRPQQGAYRGQDSRSFFGDVIKGYDVVLTADTLLYTRKKCYDLGEEDLFGFTSEVCPEVRYHINLNGLKVLQTGGKFAFFGAPGITVKGKISREILSGLQDLNPQDKETIKTMLATGNEESLPIRQGVSRDRVEAELRKVIR
jgi:hypothetical protein